jgi:hypothetical protein
MMSFTWCLNTTFFICVHLWFKNLLLHGYG